MKDQDNKDLITQMKAVLGEHEEPYMEGAWEEFSGQSKSKPVLYWTWLTATALFIIIGSLWIITSRSNIENSPVVVATRRPVKTAPGKIVPDVKDAQNSNTRSDAAVTSSHSVKKNVKKQKSGSRLPIVRDVLLAVSNPKATDRLDLSQTDKDMKITEIDSSSARKPKASDFLEFLIHERELGKSKAVAKIKPDSKWDFGVEVLPTVSNSSVNVGAGITTEYKISDHFSIGSGISMVELQAGKSLNPGISLLSARQLQSVDASFRGIDVPLNVVYNINKNLYTSIGVSYFNIIQEDRKNTFVSERQFSAVSTDPVTGLAANVRTFVSETTEEASAERLLNENSYIGFFNFSVGRKQELFKKYNIYIEPFIKVPVGKLSQQELKLTNGGMKFKVAF